MRGAFPMVNPPARALRSLRTRFISEPEYFGGYRKAIQHKKAGPLGPAFSVDRGVQVFGAGLLKSTVGAVVDPGAASK